MIENSLITLNDNAVQNNVAFLRKKFGHKVKISAVVKANAYGHGIEQIVPVFEKYGIDHYATFYYSEAVRVLDSLSKPATIMVMGWLCDQSIRDAIEKEIEFYVFNIQRLKLAIIHAKELNLKAKIHIEAETGMNRSGLNDADLQRAIDMIIEHRDYVEIAGFCTHLAGAESISNHHRIQQQLKLYKKMLAILESNELHPKYRHVANSAASMVYPKTRMDLVRVGIMLYGFWSSTEVFIQYINQKNDKIDPLKRILGWKSQIMSVKDIKTGDFVGYGISYLAQTDIKTALVPVGYSYGYSRSLSNKGRVLIGGNRCGVIGVVNMNMIIVDITNVVDAKVGDEVVIIGKQDDLEIKVSAFSDISEMLNYEILAHLSESITRTVIKA